MNKRPEEFLAARLARYEVVSHPEAFTAQEHASTAHVSGWSRAKSVVVKKEDGYAMAVLPACTFVDESIALCRDITTPAGDLHTAIRMHTPEYLRPASARIGRFEIHEGRLRHARPGAAMMYRWPAPKIPRVRRRNVKIPRCAGWR